MRRIDGLVVDRPARSPKAGRVREVMPAPGWVADEVLLIAAGHDQASERVPSRCRTSHRRPASMRGRVGGRAVAPGHAGFPRGHGIDASSLRRVRADGASVMHLVVDGRLAGRSMRCAKACASSWRLATTTAIARRLGIGEAQSDLARANKVALVHLLRRRGRRAAMAGDGIDDARARAKPAIRARALRRARVGGV
jgi:Cu+-exporting ATPase